MDCPVCKKALIVIEYKEIELDFCIHCKGFWFDAGELRLLSEMIQLQTEIPDIFSFPPAQSKEQMRKCPRCKKKMDKTILGMQPGILVDRCKKGEGIWLDQGELGQVLEQHLTHKDGKDAQIVKFLGETFKK